MVNFKRVRLSWIMDSVWHVCWILTSLVPDKLTLALLLSVLDDLSKCITLCIWRTPIELYFLG